MTPRRPFGCDGVPVAVIGQGSWQTDRDPSAAVAALRRGVELGLDHVDTAEIYGSGAAEELVGQALAGLRERVFLVSKFDPAHGTRQGTARACEASLKRLRTDWLDAYLLHWVGPHPLEETVAALEDLVRAGKILRWGVSNFDEIKLEAALVIAGAGRIACNQVLYHLGERAIEHAVLPFCARHGIAVVGYSPFAAGAFPGVDTPQGRVLERIGAAYGASPRQVALAFLTRWAGTFTIPKAVSLPHVEDNAAAARIGLNPDDIADIEAAFPLGPRRWGVPMP